ncbi:acyltransferase family protein [Chloroflexi bacterium TSY]|nr:acyltransferase family protein [Chloroflexi bacterium TSY]
MVATQRMTIESTHADEQTRSRFAYIDNLRVYLTVLVILHHAAIAYGGAGDWGVQDVVTDEISPILLSIFNAVNQAYFTPASFERKGTRQFLTDRLVRLGIPLLVYIIVVRNLNEYLLDVFYRDVPFQFRLGYAPGHLWFLQALLVFAVGYLLVRTLMDQRVAHESEPRQSQLPMQKQRYANRPVLSDRMLWSWIGVLTVLTFAVRLRFPVGVWFAGVQPGHFVHYIIAFVIGTVAWRNDWFTAISFTQARRWGIGALLALPLFVLLAVAAGVLADASNLTNVMGGWHWAAFGYALWESFVMIAMLIVLLYLFRTCFNRSNPLLQMMAANAYTVYIIHATVLYAVNIGLLSVAWPSILKFFVAGAITVSVCFLLSILIRRLPGATKVLG